MSGNGFKKIAHKSHVATAMAGSPVLRDIIYILVPYIFPVAAELIDGEFLSVTLDIAGGAHDSGPAASERGKSLHRERCSGAVSNKFVFLSVTETDEDMLCPIGIQNFEDLRRSNYVYVGPK